MELPPFVSLIILLILNSSYVQPATARSHNNFTDLESLLAFKAHAADSQGVLAANWTINTSFCNWIGVQCSIHQRVAAIHLRNFSLQGTISPHLGNLSFLSHLDLANNSLIGSIPKSLSRLPRLAYLNLQLNLLSGPISYNILNMSSVVELYLSTNNLSGTLPLNNSFIMLPRLQIISLGSNRFTGDVPSSFAQCKVLQKLSLARNQFSSNIPVEFGRLPMLSILYLGQNQLSGMIPPSLGNLTKLTELDLSYNNLTGEIPEELGNLSNLQYLSLSNNSNLIGSIPTSLLNDSLLYFLDLSVNKLSGSVPVGIGKSLPLLNWLNVGGNQLTGGLKFLSSLSNCKDLQSLGIWQNKLEGVLPNSAGNLSTNLQVFHAYKNRIKGNIPAGLGNLTGLIRLTLYDNELSGPLPSALTRLESLQLIDLASNRITGSIPFELGRMKNLNALVLESNALSGPIPDSLANISMIQHLNLDNNKLSSSIPENLWTLGSLLELDLSINNLTGSLPTTVGNLKALLSLDLSMNQLSGNISSALGELQMLAYLDLSKNSFQGQIPQLFGELISLTYLNLSYNFLSGAIPASLANLRYLSSLDLSFNKLEGKIPKGGAFSNLSIVSLMGNKALCGATRLGFPLCSVSVVSNNSGRKLRLLKYILPPTGAFLVLLTCLCLAYKFLQRRKIKTLVDTDATHLDKHREVSYYELVHATGKFSEVNLVGKGGFSSVYRGCLNDGLVVAVKVLNLEVEGASKSFDAECRVLRKVRHRNLVKIISVCSNLDFQALILQFIPKGSLDEWLYSDNYFLNMIQRLNIMVDVSSALEYLHHHHPHVVLHCDLKPRNVLLDEELVAHVSDFGIAKLLPCNNGSIATASMPGTIGCIAPEYASTGTVSRMSDVYSFGILLLETFTGRRPVDAMFGEESSLREWVCKAYLASILDVADKNLLTNQNLSQDPAMLHQCLSSVIELGLLCSSYSPKNRIPMMSVTARLQRIKMEYLSA